MWEVPPGVTSRMDTWRSESFQYPGGEGLTHSVIAPFSAFCFWSNARPYSLSSSELDFLLFMGDLWCVSERHGVQFKRWLWNLVSFYYHGSYNFKSLYRYTYLIPTVDKKRTMFCIEWLRSVVTTRQFDWYWRDPFHSCPYLYIWLAHLSYPDSVWFITSFLLYCVMLTNSHYFYSLSPSWLECFCRARLLLILVEM